MQPEVTRELVASQLEDIRELAETHDWTVDADLEALTIEVRMTSPVGEDEDEYVVRLECSEFDEKPPYVEMVHPETDEVGAYEAYFDGRGKREALIAFDDGPEDPVLCHEFNRRVYWDDTDLHNDWTMGDWQSDAGHLTTLGDIVNEIYHRISDSERYQGRYDGQR